MAKESPGKSAKHKLSWALRTVYDQYEPDAKQFVDWLGLFCKGRKILLASTLHQEEWQKETMRVLGGKMEWRLDIGQGHSTEGLRVELTGASQALLDRARDELFRSYAPNEKPTL